MQHTKRQRVLAALCTGLALILFPVGCCRVPALLFQSHAQTPGWVKAAPPASDKDMFFVGRVWARDRLDEEYVVVQARAAVAGQITAVVNAGAGQEAALSAKPPKALAQAAAALTATLAPREVYWEQWQRTCALSFTSKSYLYYMLFAVPQSEVQRLRAVSTAKPAP